jgi:hypothetical protein
VVAISPNRCRAGHSCGKQIPPANYAFGKTSVISGARY